MGTDARKDEFVWNKNDVEISQCARCVFYVSNATCAAYPNGIPDVILTNQHDHKKAYPNDNGIRFKRIESK